LIFGEGAAEIPGLTLVTIDGPKEIVTNAGDEAERMWGPDPGRFTAYAKTLPSAAAMKIMENPTSACLRVDGAIKRNFDKAIVTYRLKAGVSGSAIVYTIGIGG